MWILAPTISFGEKPGKIKALFFDFYGTIAHEDGIVIDEITTIISNTDDGTKKGIQFGNRYYLDKSE